MEHLSFDDKEVHIWLAQFPLPTSPREPQYHMGNPEGRLQYAQAFEYWHEAIGCINEGFPRQCPYSLKGNKLYIGTLYNGDIEFTLKTPSFDA